MESSLKFYCLSKKNTGLTSLVYGVIILMSKYFDEGDCTGCVCNGFETTERYDLCPGDIEGRRDRGRTLRKRSHCRYPGEKIIEIS